MEICITGQTRPRCSLKPSNCMRRVATIETPFTLISVGSDQLWNNYRSLKSRKSWASTSTIIHWFSQTTNSDYFVSLSAAISTEKLMQCQCVVIGKRRSVLLKHWTTSSGRIAHQARLLLLLIAQAE